MWPDLGGLGADRVDRVLRPSTGSPPDPAGLREALGAQSDETLCRSKQRRRSEMVSISEWIKKMRRMGHWEGRSLGFTSSFRMNFTWRLA